MRPTRSQLSRPSTAGPRRVRRRSTCMIPQSSHFSEMIAKGDPGRLRHDPLGGLPIFPKPVKLRHLRPSLKKFQEGRSSLYSVAYAIRENAKAARDVVARKSQSLLWSQVDAKEMRDQLNRTRQNRPPLPVDLSVRIKIARTAIANLLKMGFEGFQFVGIEDVFIFLKAKRLEEEGKNDDKEAVKLKYKLKRRPSTATRIKRKGMLGRISTSRSSRHFSSQNSPKRPVGSSFQDNNGDDENERLAELQARVERSNLRNNTVVIWVGSHKVAGFSQRSGLGTAYMSTGKEISGTAALLMRVAERR